MAGTRSATKASQTPGPKPSTTTTNKRTKRTTPSPQQPTWSHAPTTTTLLWLAVSLPLVAWDTGYVLGRPATMPGGWAHAPLWSPYDLYGRVDHMYGAKQWDRGNGFTAAQSALNVAESLMYAAYLGVWRYYGAAAGPGGKVVVAGRAGALAVLVAFAACVMTVSKTALYWLNEYFSGFENIGHNEPWDLFWLWIVPKCVFLGPPPVPLPPLRIG